MNRKMSAIECRAVRVVLVILGLAAIDPTRGRAETQLHQLSPITPADVAVDVAESPRPPAPPSPLPDAAKVRRDLTDCVERLRASPGDLQALGAVSGGLELLTLHLDALHARIERASATDRARARDVERKRASTTAAVQEAAATLAACRGDAERLLASADEAERQRGRDRARACAPEQVRQSARERKVAFCVRVLAALDRRQQRRAQRIQAVEAQRAVLQRLAVTLSEHLEAIEVLHAPAEDASAEPQLDLDGLSKALGDLELPDEHGLEQSLPLAEVEPSPAPSPRSGATADPKSDSLQSHATPSSYPVRAASGGER